jgi:hypothetical protein
VKQNALPGPPETPQDSRRTSGSFWRVPAPRLRLLARVELVEQTKYLFMVHRFYPNAIAPDKTPTDSVADTDLDGGPVDHMNFAALSSDFAALPHRAPMYDGQVLLQLLDIPAEA